MFSGYMSGRVPFLHHLLSFLSFLHHLTGLDCSVALVTCCVLLCIGRDAALQPDPLSGVERTVTATWRACGRIMYEGLSWFVGAPRPWRVCAFVPAGCNADILGFLFLFSFASHSVAWERAHPSTLGRRGPHILGAISGGCRVQPPPIL